MISAPDWHALCFAVCRRPDDDVPRLVAADWLDEHGAPDRAAFIRLQVEYERALRSPRPPRCREPGGTAEYCDSEWCGTCAGRRAVDAHRGRLYDRARALEAAGGAGWCGFRARQGWRLGRRRGFVQSVTLPLDVFVRHAGELFRAEPLTWVSFEGVAPLDPQVPPGGARAAPADWRPLWTWSRARFMVRGPHVLPGELFDGIPGAGGADHLDFATRLDARNALNAACVALGRRRAGLPDWEPPRL